VILALMAVFPVSAAEKGKVRSGVSATVVSAGVAKTLEGRGTVSEAPTEEQAEQAFQRARQSFLAVARGTADSKPGDVLQHNVGPEDAIAGGKARNIAMEDIRIVLDVDNVTLREVMAQIVTQAASYTGPWTVKWR